MRAAGAAGTDGAAGRRSLGTSRAHGCAGRYGGTRGAAGGLWPVLCPGIVRAWRAHRRVRTARGAVAHGRARAAGAVGANRGRALMRSCRATRPLRGTGRDGWLPTARDHRSLGAPRDLGPWRSLRGARGHGPVRAAGWWWATGPRRSTTALGPTGILGAARGHRWLLWTFGGARCPRRTAAFRRLWAVWSVWAAGAVVALGDRGDRGDVVIHGLVGSARGVGVSGAIALSGGHGTVRVAGRAHGTFGGAVPRGPNGSAGSALVCGCVRGTGDACSGRGRVGVAPGWLRPAGRDGHVLSAPERAAGGGRTPRIALLTERPGVGVSGLSLSGGSPAVETPHAGPVGREILFPGLRCGLRAQQVPAVTVLLSVRTVLRRVRMRTDESLRRLRGWDGRRPCVPTADRGGYGIVTGVSEGVSAPVVGGKERSFGARVTNVRPGTGRSTSDGRHNKRWRGHRRGPGSVLWSADVVLRGTPGFILTCVRVAE